MRVRGEVRTEWLSGAGRLRVFGALIAVAGATFALLPIGGLARAEAADITNDTSVTVEPSANGQCGQDGFGRWVKFATGNTSGVFSKNAVAGANAVLQFEQTSDNPPRFRIISLTDSGGAPMTFNSVIVFFGGSSGRQFSFDPAISDTGADFLKPSAGGSNATQLVVCSLPTTAQFTVTKNVVYPPGTSPSAPFPDPTTFPINVTCTSPTPSNPASPYNWASPAVVNLAAGATSATISAPSNTSCTALDSVAGFTTTTSGPITLDGDVATTQSVVVTNTKVAPDVEFRVIKDIVGAFAGDPQAFAIEVTCVNAAQVPIDLTPSAAGNALQLSLADGASGSVVVPYGSTCSVNEPGVDLDQWTVALPAPAALTANTTVTVVNTRRVGFIEVSKTIVANGAPVPEFSFSAVCVPGGTYTGSLTAAGGVVLLNNGQSAVPAGATCSVTEVGALGWTSVPGFSNPVTVQADSRHLTSFTNTRDVGSLVITKTAVGADASTTTFDFTVTCGAHDPVAVTITGSGTHTISGIPTGTTCVVDELTESGWTQTVPASNATITAVIAAGTNGAAFTNVRDTAGLVISKNAVGGIGTFTMTVVCGESTITEQQITLDNDPTTAAILNTVTIEGIPTGTLCSVTEDPTADWTLSSIVGGTVNVNTRSTTLTMASTGNVATFTNTRDTGTISVTKTIDGGPGGDFSFGITCPSTGYSGTVTLTVAAPSNSATAAVTPSPIPTAADCQIAETATGAGYTGAAPQNLAVVLGQNTAISFSNHWVNADIAIEKTASQPVVLAGTALSYTLAVTNNGPDAAAGVTVTDAIPAGLNNVVTTPGAPTCAVASGEITCGLGTLSSGATRLITVSGVTDPALTDTSTITNTAVVTSTTPDPDPTDNTDTVVTDVDRRADLGVQKTGPAVAEPGNTVVFEITLSNAGPSTATNIALTELPTNLGSCTPTPASLAIATLTPGAAAKWSVSCSPVPAATSASNSVEITESSLDANNDPVEGDEAPDSAIVNVGIAAMTFDKSVSPDAFTGVGQTLTYTFVITNTGGINLSGLTISDAKITGPYVCRIGSTTFDLTAGTLAPGQAVRCTATYVTTAADVAALQVTNTASADTNETTIPIEDTVTIPARLPADAPTVDLSIRKSVVTLTASGQPATWELIVRNAGPSTDAGVRVVDTLPAGVTFVSASGTNWSCSAVAATITCNYSGSVAAGLTLPTISIVGKVTATSGVLTNVATVTGTITDIDLSNNRASATSTVVPLPRPILPDTGSNLSPQLMLGSSVTTLGLGLMAAARRRKPTPAT